MHRLIVAPPYARRLSSIAPEFAAVRLISAVSGQPIELRQFLLCAVVYLMVMVNFVSPPAAAHECRLTIGTRERFKIAAAKWSWPDKQPGDR